MRHLAIGAALALAGSFTAALAASLYLGLQSGRHFVSDLAVWTLADVLGLVILAPCLLILADWRRYVAERPITARAVAIMIAVIAVQFVVFAQTRYPVLFLAPLAALTASMVLEMLGAAILVLVTATLAMGFTLAGQGSIILSATGWTERLFLLQGFVAVCSLLNLHVAAMQQHRRRASRALAEALAEAEQAARVKAEFLANMSHEIRTPLTSILGFASLLAAKDLGEESGRYANRILGASRNLLALVNDVLDFSKLEAGGLEIKHKSGCPDQCGRDTVDLFAAAAAAKSLTLSFEAERLPAYVTADFDRIRQVLMNLVGNAVKFTTAGGVRVSGRYDARTGALSYRVADTGPGLDAADRDKLFKRFSQVDAGVNRAHGGSGLGLAISKGLVEAMGGRIGVESRRGEGSTFWFEAPAPVAEAGPQDPAANVDMGAFLGLKVLLVDDNPANRELIRSLLSPLGVALTTADGGEAATRASQLQAFQLILMDLRMPGVDGWTAARAIRGVAGPNRETPMLAFSADIAADDDAVLDVFEGVVRKPIEMAELLHAILRWTAESAEPAPQGRENATAAPLTRTHGTM
jgi:signal transduction histidine kinase/CheY-like chemotaxis protein